MVSFISALRRRSRRRAVLRWARRAWCPKRALAAVVFVVACVLSEMMTDWQLQLAGTVFATLGAIIALWFSYRYWRKSQWSTTIAGRSLLYVMLGFGLFMAQVSIGNWTTVIIDSEAGYPLRLEFRANLNFWIVVVLFNMLYVLISIQEGRRK